MGKILSGKEAAEEILDRIKTRIKKLERPPSLHIVLAGEDKASRIYVNMKKKKAEKIGIKSKVHYLPKEVSEKELVSLVEKLNGDEGVDGFIVQAPIPKHINSERIFRAIKPSKDVDGWTLENMGKLFMGDKSGFPPATPAGVMKMLEYHGIEISGKNAVVIGRSNVVGKPMAVLLLKKNATVTVCHSKTKSLEEHTLKADIIIAAAGVPGLVKGSMVKKGASVIDVGTTKVNGKLKGDAEFDEIIKKADCSPVPGGVGPMTVAMLLMNTAVAAERRC